VLRLSPYHTKKGPWKLPATLFTPPAVPKTVSSSEYRILAPHRAHPGTATLALYYRRDPTHSGIAAFDRRGRITRFIEKPRADQIFSRWVSAGIFVLEPSALDAVPAGAAVDFGRHVFPNLLAQGARLHGYRMGSDEKLVWIDRPEDLRRAEARWKHLAASFEAS